MTLVYKWGTPTDNFTNVGQRHIGRAGGYMQKYIVEYILENKGQCEVHTEGKCSNIIILPKGAKRIENFNQSKADKVIIVAGPDNDEFNDKFVKWLNNSNITDIVLVSNDMRFLSLKGVTKDYKVLSEFYVDKEVDGRMILANQGINIMYTLKNIENSKSDKIVIFANENHQSWEQCRAKRVIEYAKLNPELNFMFYGYYPKWAEKIIGDKPFNLEFVNTHFDMIEYFNEMRKYKFCLILDGDKGQGEQIDKQANYPQNYITVKLYETLVNYTIPLIDMSEIEMKNEINYAPILTIVKDKKNLTKQVEYIKSQFDVRKEIYRYWWGFLADEL